MEHNISTAFLVDLSRDVKQAECKESGTELPPNFIAEEEAAEASELDNMTKAYEDVVELVHSGAEVVNNVRIECSVG